MSVSLSIMLNGRCRKYLIKSERVQACSYGHPHAIHVSVLSSERAAFSSALSELLPFASRTNSASSSANEDGI